MAVAFDAVSSVAAGTGDLSWTHTPTGTPRGIKVDIVENDGVGGVSSVTYGGVGMTLVALNEHTTSEPGTIHTYFLGSNIPTGAQTVSVTVSDTTTSKRAVAISVTASTDTVVTAVNQSINSDSLSNPSTSLGVLARSSFVSLALHSGQAAASGVTQLSGWTNRLETDFGNQVAGWYSYNTIGTSAVTCGWTQTAEDAVMTAIAITEAPVLSESVPVGFTESVSVSITSYTRVLPIGLVEAVSVSAVLSAGDSLSVQTTEAASISRAASAVESSAIQLSEQATVITLASAIDTAAFTFGESTPSVVDTNTATRNTSDTHAIGMLDTVVSVVSFVSVDDTGPRISDALTDLNVFTGNSTENISVADTLVVRMNGRDEEAPVIPVSATDSLAIQSTDSIFSIPSIVLFATESLRIGTTDTAASPLVSVAMSDSLAVGLTEPNDQQSAFGVLDAVAVTHADSSPVISGDFVFTTSDSVAVLVGEARPTFGQVSVGAGETVVVQASESLFASKAVATSDAVSVQSSEVLSASKAISLTDSCAVQGIDSAIPVFDSFIDITASDTAACGASESITQLVSFLQQLQVTDSCIIGCLDSDLSGVSALSCSDTISAVFSSAIDIATSAFTNDALLVGTIEAGLAIPIVSVNVTAFTDDLIIVGLSDSASISVAYEALEYSVSDTVAVRGSDDGLAQYGFFTEDECLVGVGEVATDTVTENATPVTWDGRTPCEHGRQTSRPSSYIIKDRHHW